MQEVVKEPFRFRPKREYYKHKAPGEITSVELAAELGVLLNLETELKEKIRLKRILLDSKIEKERAVMLQKAQRRAG